MKPEQKKFFLLMLGVVIYGFTTYLLVSNIFRLFSYL